MSTLTDHLRPSRFASALSALLLAANLAASELPALPALAGPDDPPLHGKFVWADLVTDDFAAARDFYVELFELDWVPITSTPTSYGLLERNGVAVAGIAERPGEGAGQRSGHWLHFVSVADVAAAEAAFARAGGRTVLERRVLPERGTMAAVQGPRGEVVGLLRASGGDPPDYRSEPGEWLWRELLTPDIAASAAAYEAICDCDVFAGEEDPERLFITSQGHLRGAISAAPEGAPRATWIGVIRVADLERLLDRAKGLGAELLVEPSDDRFAEGFAMIRDPVGGLLAMIEWDYEAEAAQ